MCFLRPFYVFFCYLCRISDMFEELCLFKLTIKANSWNDNKNRLWVCHNETNHYFHKAKTGQNTFRAWCGKKSYALWKKKIILKTFTREYSSYHALHKNIIGFIKLYQTKFFLTKPSFRRTFFTFLIKVEIKNESRAFKTNQEKIIIKQLKLKNFHVRDTFDEMALNEPQQNHTYAW